MPTHCFCINCFICLRCHLYRQPRWSDFIHGFKFCKKMHKLGWVGGYECEVFSHRPQYNFISPKVGEYIVLSLQQLSDRLRLKGHWLTDKTQIAPCSADISLRKEKFIIREYIANFNNSRVLHYYYHRPVWLIKFSSSEGISMNDPVKHLIATYTFIVLQAHPVSFTRYRWRTRDQYKGFSKGLLIFFYWPSVPILRQSTPCRVPFCACFRGL